MEEFKNSVLNHEKSTFPADLYGKSINDINLLVLDTEITSRLITLVETNGKLSSRSKKELYALQIELISIIPNLSGDAKSYFSNLLDVLKIVGLEE